MRLRQKTFKNSLKSLSNWLTIQTDSKSVRAPPPAPLQSLGYEIIPVICRLLNPEKGAGFPGQPAICQRSPLLFPHISTWLAGTGPGWAGPPAAPPAGAQRRQSHADTLTVPDEQKRQHAQQVYGRTVRTRAWTHKYTHRWIRVILN